MPRIERTRNNRPGRTVGPDRRRRDSSCRRVRPWARSNPKSTTNPPNAQSTSSPRTRTWPSTSHSKAEWTQLTAPKQAMASGRRALRTNTRSEVVSMVVREQLRKRTHSHLVWPTNQTIKKYHSIILVWLTLPSTFWSNQAGCWDSVRSFSHTHSQSRWAISALSHPPKSKRIDNR